MRIRSIKPEFCTDEKIGALSREARLHFILLWMAADRHGTVEYRTRQLSAMLYPFDEDMDNSRFEALTSAVLQQSLCSRFTANGRDYLHITNFEKHQSLTTWERKESRPLMPPKELRKYCGSTAEVLRSEERRGEESTEPPNPQGGLSEGELRFDPMLKIIAASGKGPSSLTHGALGMFWRSAPPGSDPCDAGWLDWLKAQLAGHTGRVGSMSPWLQKRAMEYFGKNKISPAGESGSFGPPAGEM